MAVIPGAPIIVPEGSVIGISHAVDSYGALYRIHPVGFMKSNAMGTDQELEKREWDFVVGNGVTLPKESYTLESEQGNRHGFWLPVNLAHEDERVMHPLRVYAVPKGWLESSEMSNKAPRSRDFI